MRFGTITKEFILRKISEEDIFFKYLGIKPSLDIPFRNPLRNDKTADCWFYIDSRKVLKFKDFAQGWNWDCFNVVQILHGQCSFGKALYIIAEDFELLGNISKSEPRIISTISDIEKIPKEKTTLEIQIRKFNKVDAEYWKKYYIDSKMLKFYHVYPVEKAWKNQSLCYFYRDTDPCYAYWFGKDINGIDEFKFYFPFRKEMRFIQNISPSVLQGYNQLPKTGNTLFITKSMKDVIAMRMFGLRSVAPVSETVMLTPQQYQDLSKRFENILSLTDNDKSGNKLSIKLRKEYNIQPLKFSLEDKKDFTDNLIEYGYQYMIDYITYTESLLNIKSVLNLKKIKKLR